jgi:hypothetical protein
MLAVSFQSFTANVIFPDNPNIQYLGRFDHSNPQSPAFNWTGTQIVANFEGTSLQLLLKCTARTYFNISIDRMTSILIAVNTKDTYQLCSGLKSGKHSVIIFRRDSPWVTATFNGFILDDGKKLLPPPTRKNRKIEFYGDSQTQGAQVEVPGFALDEHQMIDDNNYYSYAAITARALHAEFSVIANNSATLSPKHDELAIPDIYDRVGPGTDFARWDFNGWKPDVMVVNLGVNDMMNTPDYAGKYIDFVKKLRSVNLQAPIFLVNGPLWCPDTLKSEIVNAVKTLNSQGDDKVYYYEFKTFVKDHRHARTAENVECAKELAEQIQKVIWKEIFPSSTVEDVYITPITDELTIGKALQLSATVSPFDAKNKAVRWKVSDPQIAQIDQNGLLTAVSKGRVFITATSADGKHATSCSLAIKSSQK